MLEPRSVLGSTDLRMGLACQAEIALSSVTIHSFKIPSTVVNQEREILDYLLDLPLVWS